MKTNLKLITGGKQVGPSERFLNLTRNVGLESPTRFIPTKKAEGDVII